MRLQSHPNQFYFVPLINLTYCNILSSFNMMLDKRIMKQHKGLIFSYPLIPKIHLWNKTHISSFNILELMKIHKLNLMLLLEWHKGKAIYIHYKSNLLDFLAYKYIRSILKNICENNVFYNLLTHKDQKFLFQVIQS